MDIKATVIQNSWRSYKMCKVPKLIVKNISKIKNEIDPISSYDLIKNNKILTDLDRLYLIAKKNNYYLYEISSLNMLIDNNQNETFSNEKFSKSEIKKEIKFYFKEKENICIRQKEISEKEKEFCLKTKISIHFLN